MVIPDIQTQNLNGANFQPNISTVDVIKTQNAVAAVNTGNKSGSSTADSDASDTLAAYTTTVTLTSEKSRTGKSGDAADKKTAQEKIDQQETAKKERSMTMTGIPLYGGILVSVIKYPNGQSEMFDVLTGKPVTSEDIALHNVLLGAESDQVLHFESTESFSGLSEAEVYQRIQELQGNDNNSSGTA